MREGIRRMRCVDRREVMARWLSVDVRERIRVVRRCVEVRERVVRVCVDMSERIVSHGNLLG